MPRTWPERERELMGRVLLDRIGLVLSPEFASSVFAAPRLKLNTGGWQSGKSVGGACEILLDFGLWVREPRDYRYWVIVPSYETPHKEMDYLAEWAGMLGIRQAVHMPQGGAVSLTMRVPGGARIIVETKTAQNLAGIAGEPCDGVLVVEAGQIADGVQEAAQGRVMTRRGWVVYTGTLEDDENTPRWSWYSDRAEEWSGHGPGMDERSFALPSWANLAVFPGGESDPEIGRLRNLLDPYTFDRRIAARPSGVANPAYPQLLTKPLLLPMPAEAKARVIRSTGGIDPGSVHPSALTVVSLLDDNDLWVRRCVFLPGIARGSTEAGDANLIDMWRRLLTSEYKVSRWETDPNTPHFAGLMSAEAAPTGAGSRARRMSYVSARLDGTGGRIFYDASGEGVPDLYEEQRRVHYVKDARGQLVLWRVDDDRTASLEDAVEAMDTGPEALPELGGSTSSYPKTEQKRRRQTRATDGRDRERSQGRKLVHGLPGKVAR